MTSGELSQSLFHLVGDTLVAVIDHRSAAFPSSRSSARMWKSARLPEYSSGYPSGSLVTDPLMMSPMSNGSRMSSPVSGSMKWMCLS